MSHIQDERLMDENQYSWDVYSIINILTVGLCETLDSITEDQLANQADSNQLYNHLLPRISEILGQYSTKYINYDDGLDDLCDLVSSVFWYSTLFSWWRIEKNKRLFITGNTKLFILDYTRLKISFQTILNYSQSK